MKSFKRPGTRDRRVILKLVKQKFTQKQREKKETFRKSIKDESANLMCNTNVSDPDYKTRKEMLRVELMNMGPLSQENYRSKLAETCKMENMDVHVQKKILKNTLSTVQRFLSGDRHAIEMKGNPGVDQSQLPDIEERLHTFENIAEYIQLFLNSFENPRYNPDVLHSQPPLVKSRKTRPQNYSRKNSVKEKAESLARFLETSDSKGLHPDYKGGRKWSAKYKRSIDCSNPKGFSQKQHCKYGRKTRKQR